MKLVIVDGMEGAGKSTLITNLVKRTGGAILDPERGDHHIHDEWNETLESVADLFKSNMIVFMDRGLGSEFVFGPSRDPFGSGYGDEVFSVLEESVEWFAEHDIEVFEVILVCDHYTAKERNGKPLSECDNYQAWYDWALCLKKAKVPLSVVDTTLDSAEAIASKVYATLWPIANSNLPEKRNVGVSVLDYLLERQIELMEAIGLDHKAEKTMMASLAGIIGEAAEALQEMTKNKPWKNIRENAFEDEVTDVLFFLLEAYVCMGFTSQNIVNFYDAKWQKNMSRLEAARIEKDRINRTMELTLARG